MKFPYAVTHNGITYKPNEEIPESGAKVVEPIKEVEPTKNNDAPLVENKAVEYSKTDINRMSTADLKVLAKANGVKDVDAKSGADLKKELIKKFDL